MRAPTTLEDLIESCDAFLSRYREARRNGMEPPKNALRLIGGTAKTATTSVTTVGRASLLAVRASQGTKR